jgi:hypothetical protein
VILSIPGSLPSPYGDVGRVSIVIDKGPLHLVGVGRADPKHGINLFPIAVVDSPGAM